MKRSKGTGKKRRRRKEKSRKSLKRRKQTESSLYARFVVQMTAPLSTNIWQKGRGPLGKVVGHSGGFDGIDSQLDIYVDAGYIVAVMSNIDRGASPLAAKIGRVLGRIKSN